MRHLYYGCESDVGVLGVVGTDGEICGTVLTFATAAARTRMTWAKNPIVVVCLMDISAFDKTASSWIFSETEVHGGVFAAGKASMLCSVSVKEG